MSDVARWVDEKYHDKSCDAPYTSDCGYRDALIEAVELLKEWRSTVVNPEEKEHCTFDGCVICSTLKFLEGLDDNT